MIWFTADLHLGHENVLKFDQRPFQTIEEHDRRLLKNITDALRPSDTLIVVGDFSLSRSEQIRHYFSVLKDAGINLILVRGNHDKNALSVWPLVVERLDMKICRKLCRIQHVPYQRQLSWIARLLGVRLPRWEQGRSKDEGQWLIHGHAHAKTPLRRKSINVSVTAWGYKPVSIRQIRGIIQRNKQKEEVFGDEPT